MKDLNILRRRDSSNTHGAFEDSKRSNQMVVKEKHAFIFYGLENKIKEEKNCSETV